MTDKIAVIASTENRRVTSSTWECFAFAQQLAQDVNATITLIFIGERSNEVAGRISAKTGCKAIAVDLPGTERYHGELVQKALVRVLKKAPHTYIVAPHTTSGMDYAPALALDLGGTCITAVEELRTKGGVLGFIRSMFNGKIQAEMRAPNASLSSPLIVTLQTGAVKPVKPDENRPPDLCHCRFDIEAKHMKYQKTRPSPFQGSDLAKADVIVSGGRGIQDADNYQLIEMLAGIFPRAATGASRPICDYGWASYAKQVGATGAVVAPKLYIACGISGAIQHLEGIRDARFVVAINKDAFAPIFKTADLCVVEDLVTFIPLVKQVWEEKKTSSAADTL
jgi:electron transfer flavoprotein alpha subunit